MEKRKGVGSLYLRGFGGHEPSEFLGVPGTRCSGVLLTE